MPSGKTHTLLTLATASGVLAPYAIVQVGMNPWVYGAGMLLGVFISPDMDVDRGNISDQIIRKVSTPGQLMWRAFWTPYAWSVPHRHTISHFPILGTVLRIGYIFMVLNIVNLAVRLGLSMVYVDTVSIIWLWDWSFFFGLAHADLIHWIADNTIKGKEVFENAEER